MGSMTWRTAALCAGYGGLEMGLTLAGVDHELEWYAEIDPHASLVMAHHHPDVPNLGDLTTITTERLEMSTLAEHQRRAERMYSAYCSGLSMADVGEQFNVSRQTVFMMFKRRNWDTRPTYVRRLPEQHYGGRKFTFMKSTGYMRATDGDRELMHRYIWKVEVGEIPPGHDIHHVDHNRLNNDLANLECLEHAVHTSRHALEAREAGEPKEPNIDIVTAGFPRSLPARFNRWGAKGNHR